jgi:outer membrane protein assembly factor BamB
MNMTLSPLALALAGLSILAPAPADRHDWPQWRGPNRDDVSTETGLLKSWPKDGPKLLWTYTDAGIGYSGFAVVGNRLYSMGGDEKKEYVFALDVEKCSLVWQQEIGDFYTNGNGDGPRATPTVDGEFLYVLGPKGDLVCLDLAKGEKKWAVSLTSKEIGGGVPGWGYCESVLIDGDKLICTPGGSKGTMAAFDKKDGKLIWQSKEITEGAHYSSVVIGNGGGMRHYVQMTGESVFGVDPADGKLLWKYPRKGPTAAVPTPVVKGDFVFATSGYDAGCHMVSLSADGPGKIKFKEEYTSKDMVNHHGGVVLVGDYLYGYSDSKGWICQELKTGKVIWPEKDRVKLGKGSVTYADGHLYCFDEGHGTVALVEATPKEQWKEVGRFKIPQETKKTRKGGIWTHPVVANGRLYLRDQDLIFCFDIKEAK